MELYEFVIKRCKRYESFLVERHGATGRGLHEKADSVAGKIGLAVVKKLHFVATIRNKLVHEDGFSQSLDVDAYRAACDWLDRRLLGRRPGLFGRLSGWFRGRR